MAAAFWQLPLDRNGKKVATHTVMRGADEVHVQNVHLIDPDTDKRLGGQSEPLYVRFVSAPSITGSVSVSNFPASFGISGNVNVGNFPASFGVTGNVAVTNFPAGFSVTGSTITVANFPNVQQVGGTVNVGNWPAVIQVQIQGTVPLPTNAAQQDTLAQIKDALTSPTSGIDVRDRTTRELGIAHANDFTALLKFEPRADEELRVEEDATARYHAAATAGASTADAVWKAVRFLKGTTANGKTQFVRVQYRTGVRFDQITSGW